MNDTLLRLFQASRVVARVQHPAHADPDAVILGAAAARLTYWPTLPVPETIAAASRLRDRPGFEFIRTDVPRRLVRRLRTPRCLVSSRALTALDLAEETTAESIDRALLAHTTLAELWDAFHLTPHRRGNLARRLLLEDSRDSPWSPPERRGHRALRAAGVVGWRANLRIQLAHSYAVPDIAFPDLRLAFEIYGYEYHGSHNAFRRDRARDTALAALGWHVVRFAASFVMDQPEAFAARVVAIADRRRNDLGLPPRAARPISRRS